MSAETDKALEDHGLHKAEPFEKWAEHTLGTACQHCGQEIKRVPGGHGPIWVHSQTGMVVGTAEKPTWSGLWGIDPDYPTDEPDHA